MNVERSFLCARITWECIHYAAFNSTHKNKSIHFNWHFIIAYILFPQHSLSIHRASVTYNTQNTKALNYNFHTTTITTTSYENFHFTVVLKFSPSIEIFLSCISKINISLERLCMLFILVALRYWEQEEA